MARSIIEIDNLIKKLQQSRKVLPEVSFFGDNNWEAIDAQIWVLSNKKTEDEIEGEFEDHHTKEMALLALDWMNGDIEEDEII